jgi:hypothetical protein
VPAAPGARSAIRAIARGGRLVRRLQPRRDVTQRASPRASELRAGRIAASSRPRPLSLARFAVIATAAACAEVGSLQLTPAPATAPADGMAILAITAEAEAAELAVPDGTPISFRADAALLFAARADAEPAFPGARPTGALELTAATRASAATVYLLAPTEPTDLHVDARFSPEPGVEVNASISIRFEPPPPVSAGAGDLEAPGGVDVHFAFRCEADNVGAFVPGRPEIAVPCRVVLEDRDGAILPHAPLRLFAEAGELIDLPAAASAPRGVFYLAPSPVTRYPADVAPLPLEAPYARDGAGLIPGAEEQNPRDGLVTLLAVVRGDEAFDDLDGDGRWTADEPFVDEGEPFLDVDDDGVHDPAIDGPACCDRNGNGEVDGPNGTWDGDVWLGRAAHLLWTGPVDESDGRSGIAGPAAIGDGGTAGYAITAVDGNYNPVAMLGADDGLVIDATGPVAILSPDIEIDDRLGLTVADEYPFHRFGDGAPVITGLTVDGVRRFGLAVTDARNGACAPASCALEVEVRHSAGADFGDLEFAQRVSRLVHGATLTCP